MNEVEINIIIDYFIDKNRYWVPKIRTIHPDGTTSVFGGWWSTKHDWKGEWIDKAYREARISFEIPIDYEEFSRRLLYKAGEYRSLGSWAPRQWKKKGRFGHYPWNKPSAYRRKPEHKKKELSEHEVAKREWREHKGINKDNARPTYRRSGIPKWIKRHCNKMVRQYDKQMIYNERWDELHNNEYKYFLGPWYWN